MTKLFKREEDIKLIVFIHGITGSINTWNNEKTSFSFPRILHEELNNHSVYIFQYDSNKFSKSTEFYEIVKNLSIELNNIISEKYEEILFIAHSMGGLIAKTLLIDPTLSSISKKVNKLILLATPNNGNFFPKIVSHLSKNPQFNNLKPIDDNIFLQQLTDMWIKKYGNNGTSMNSIQCYCGYEKLKTFLKVLVPLTTVSSPCCDVLKGFNKNHITIAKPDNAEDEVYQWVKKRINTKLSNIEKLSKIGLSKLYNSKISELESKINKLESKILENFNSNTEDSIIENFNSNTEDSIIEKYIQLKNEYERINSSYEKFDNIANNLIISDNEITQLFTLVKEQKLDDALDIFSEEEIDHEILQLNKQKSVILQKIRINIELYNLKNDFSNILKYYNKIFKIEKNEKDLLEYANINKYIGEYATAEKIYLEIIKITNEKMVKAVCLNNLGTMAIASYISYQKALEYLKDAYLTYESLYNNSRSELFLASYIETRMNYLLFELKANHTYQNTLFELNKLLKKTESIDVSSENFTKLQFYLLNNIFAIYIEYENINEDTYTYLEGINTQLNKIINSIIDNNLFIQKKYAEYLALYYYNNGSFYGYIFKSNIHDTKIFDSSIKYFQKSLKIRNTLLPKTQENLQHIISTERSIGITYADSGKYKQEAKEIFEKTLNKINTLIKNFPENQKMYLEQKIEVIICYISIEPNNSNLEKYNKAIKYLDILDNLNPNTYNMLYCRLILMTIPSLSDSKKQQEIYNLAKNKLKNTNGDISHKMNQNLDKFKEIFNF
ncbi:hypothetical protein [Halarcobacter anaerophilus]|uniref:alpha/beta hydrolase n=1 Tax=Halarcobacter anaerophilus TaxID=877500 RepID=UPI0005CB09A3|nr:hypothetical protein [Halarcobacter anaerophilus]